MPQQLVRCAVCRQRPQERLAQVTWAWVDAEHLRTAYRQRLCSACFVGRVLALEKETDSDSELTCVACGISVEDEFRILYCTAFVPGAGKLQYQFPFCEQHMLIAETMCQENGILLQEREDMLRGQAPQQESPSLTAWRALGILPNE